MSVRFLPWLEHTFQDGHADPSRVGGPTNHLLSDGDLETEISIPAKGTGDMSLFRALQRTAARASDPDRSLKTAYAHINKLCGALGLQRDASTLSCEIYKDAASYLDSKGQKRKSTAAMCAAVVYAACRWTAHVDECCRHADDSNANGSTLHCGRDLCAHSRKIRRQDRGSDRQALMSC